MLNKAEREALGLPAPTNGTEMYLSAILARLNQMADDTIDTTLQTLASAAEAPATDEIVPLREPETPANAGGKKKPR